METHTHHEVLPIVTIHVNTELLFPEPLYDPHIVSVFTRLDYPLDLLCIDL